MGAESREIRRLGPSRGRVHETGTQRRVRKSPSALANWWEDDSGTIECGLRGGHPMTKEFTVMEPRRRRGARERHRLDVLYEVTRRLATVDETDAMLTLIINEAARLIDVEASGLRLVEGDELVLRACTESAAELMSRRRLKFGESLSGLVLTRGEPVIVADLVED